MSELNPTCVISKKNELLSSEIDGEVVMMNIETGKYIGMNSVGSEIWKILEKEPISISQISERLSKVFKVEASTCEKEVLNFCNRMLNEKLIQLS
jgi:hypothetical protein